MSEYRLLDQVHKAVPEPFALSPLHPIGHFFSDVKDVLQVKIVPSLLKTLFNFFFVLNISLGDHKLKALDVVLANVLNMVYIL